MDFLGDEMPKAFDRTFDGVERVTNIVKAMKEFAHPDTTEQGPADINHALETTLLVASNEYKYLTKIHTDLAELPEIVSHALLEPKSAHALLSPGETDSVIDAAYLASLNAPFDWDEAQRRVRSSAAPAN